MHSRYSNATAVRRGARQLSFAAASLLIATLASSANAAADDGIHAGLARCANQDLKLESVLSDSIISQELPAQRYVAAAEFRIAARRACGAGQFDAAMVLFDKAAGEVGLHLGSSDPVAD